MSCEICGTTEDVRSMQTTRPAPAQMPIPGTDDARVVAALRAREMARTLTAAEQSVLDTLVRLGGRPLTSEEKYLALEQARMVGAL